MILAHAPYWEGPEFHDHMYVQCILVTTEWLFMAKFFTSVCIKHIFLQLYVNVQVAVPMLSQVPGHADVDGSGGIAPCILNFGIRWM
jgi:hypothetical protein